MTLDPQLDRCSIRIWSAVSSSAEKLCDGRNYETMLLASLDLTPMIDAVAHSLKTSVSTERQLHVFGMALILLCLLRYEKVMIFLVLLHTIRTYLTVNSVNTD